MNPVKPLFQAAKKASTLELYLYDEIGRDPWTGGGIAASDIAAAIKEAGQIEGIVLRINSPGGSVFEGSAIYSLLRAQGVPVSVTVDGLAASAAFTIAMAGDSIEIGESAMMMLHNAWGMVMGESKDMRQQADLLDKIGEVMAGIYAKRSGLPLERIKAMMDAETWLTPDEAVQNGFAGMVVMTSSDQQASMKALASQLLARSKSTHFAKVPDAFKAEEKTADTVASKLFVTVDASAVKDVVDAAIQAAREPPKAENANGCDCTCPECMDDDCEDCSNADCVDVVCLTFQTGSDEGMRTRNVARLKLAEHVAFLHS